MIALALDAYGLRPPCIWAVVWHASSRVTGLVIALAFYQIAPQHFLYFLPMKGHEFYMV